jgi:flagellar operon protein
MSMTLQQRRARVPPQRVQQPSPQSPPADRSAPDTDGTSFADHLESARKPSGDVQLSAHAQKRVQQRNISFTPTEQRALSDAVQQLDAKGARNAAVLREDAAFVVNVPNRTVVTALDHSEMQHRVFTQIDSAMKL